jgi:excisionase family DNA binding protein
LSMASVVAVAVGDDILSTPASMSIPRTDPRAHHKRSWRAPGRCRGIPELQDFIKALICERDDVTRGVVEIDVAEAADRLGVHPSRVRVLLRRGELSGRRLGSRWLVAEEDVARLVVHGARGTRPPSPARAWGLLHLLQGRDPGWLSPVARSQLRARVRELAWADAARWRAMLRGRSDVRISYVKPRPGSQRVETCLVVVHRRGGSCRPRRRGGV